MANKHDLRRLYLLAAILFAFTVSFHAAVSRGIDLQGMELYQFVEAILIMVWLMMDPALPPVQRPSFDHGLLLWMSFPFLAMYHQFITRRWKGMATVLGLLLLLYAPFVVTVVLLCQAPGSEDILRRNPNTPRLA